MTDTPQTPDLTITRAPERIDEIYRLIEQGDTDGAQAIIAETNAGFPDWTPPAGMMELLSLSKAQAELDAAAGAKDAATLIGIVRGVPSLLSCERINNAWQLAEAHLLLGDTNAALGIYRGVLQTCRASETLIATLEKAAVIAPSDILAEFSDVAQANTPEASAEIRLTEDRLRVGRQEPPRWQNGETVIELEQAATTPAAVPDGGPVAAVTPVTPPAARSETPATAPAPAMTPAPASSPAVGTGSGGLSGIQAAAQRGAWAQCLALSAGSTRVDVVAQRGWCAYNADRTLEAITAFQDAARRGTSSDMRRDASYGLLLSMLKLNMTEQAAQVAASAPLSHDQRVEVEGQILDQRGVRAYNTGEYAKAVAFLSAHESLTGTTRRDLALLRGYALLNLGDSVGARNIFERLHRQLSTAETRRAMRALN
jgi:tetratricopeptide (TPR) repeat protein